MNKMPAGRRQRRADIEQKFPINAPALAMAFARSLAKWLQAL
jgi:hypothetical protein